MERIGVRELRQHASKYLERVERGERIEVTNRGKPVAMLVPVAPMSTLERLRAEGRTIPAKGRLRDLPPPLPRKPGERTLTAVLLEMRAEERF